MVNYETICHRIQRKMCCDNNTAWTAISQAYLSMDTNIPEQQQAYYLYNTGCFRVMDIYCQNRLLDMANTHMTSMIKQIQKKSDDADSITEDDLFKAPPEVQLDIDYIIDIINGIPEQYRIPVTVVMTELLKNSERKRKPLTVEMTRQYLKRARVPNTSEMARQVFTYLTTFNK